MGICSHTAYLLELLRQSVGTRSYSVSEPLNTGERLTHKELHPGHVGKHWEHSRPPALLKQTVPELERWPRV